MVWHIGLGHELSFYLRFFDTTSKNHALFRLIIPESIFLKGNADCKAYLLFYSFMNGSVKKLIKFV